MRKELKRIGPLSVGIIYAVILAVVGFILGVFIAVGSMNGVVAADPELAPLARFGPLAVIILPLFYGVFGFIAGLVIAFVYNLAAALVGGVVMTFEDQ